MSQIIAIDLGTYSIKVASLDLSKSKNGFSYQDRIIPQVYGSPEFSYKEALSDLIDEGLNINETVIITFPDASVSTHSISLPFTDNRKIEQILPMQIDERVPFDLSEYFVTYQILGKNEHGAEVVAAATKDQKLQGQ